MILSPHSFLIILLSYIPLSCIWETLFVAQWPPFFMTRIYTQPLLQTALLGRAVPDIIGYTIVIWVISISISLCIHIYIYLHIHIPIYIQISIYIYILTTPTAPPTGSLHSAPDRQADDWTSAFSWHICSEGWWVPGRSNNPWWVTWEWPRWGYIRKGTYTHIYIYIYIYNKNNQHYDNYII